MDGTEGQEGSLPKEGQTPGAQTQGTSTTEPKTFTEEQVQKQVSDALAKAGRDAKSFETRETTLKAQEDAIKAERDKIAQWQAERDKEEVDAARDNPELLDIVQRRKKLRDAEAKLATDRATFEEERQQHKEKLDAATESEREIAIFELGEKYSVDPVKLKALNLGLEETERVAQAMSSGEPLKPGEKPPIKPDSGKTIGGIGIDTDKANGRQLIEHGLANKNK